LLAFGLQRVPVGRQRCEHLLFLRTKLLPAETFLHSTRADILGDGQGRSKQKRENQPYSSECLSQLLKPRSR
jgi:hypothetical protein